MAENAHQVGWFQRASGACRSYSNRSFGRGPVNVSATQALKALTGAGSVSPEPSGTRLANCGSGSPGQNRDPLLPQNAAPGPADDDEPRPAGTARSAAPRGTSASGYIGNQRYPAAVVDAAFRIETRVKAGALQQRPRPDAKFVGTGRLVTHGVKRWIETTEIVDGLQARALVSVGTVVSQWADTTRIAAGRPSSAPKVWQESISRLFRFQEQAGCAVRYENAGERHGITSGIEMYAQNRPAR